MSNATPYNDTFSIDDFTRSCNYLLGEPYDITNYSHNSPSVNIPGLVDKPDNICRKSDSTSVDYAPAEPALPLPPAVSQEPALQAPVPQLSMGLLGCTSSFLSVELLERHVSSNLAKSAKFMQPNRQLAQFPTPISFANSPAVLTSVMNGHNWGHSVAGPSQPTNYPFQGNQAGALWDPQITPMAGPSVYPTQPNYNPVAPFPEQYQANHDDQALPPNLPFTFGAEAPFTPKFSPQLDVSAFPQSTHLALSRFVPMPMEPIAPAPAPAPAPSLAPALAPAPTPAPAQAPQAPHPSLIRSKSISRVQSGQKRKSSLRHQLSTVSTMSIGDDQGRPTKRRKNRAPSVSNTEFQLLRQLQLNAPGKYYTHPPDYKPDFSGAGDAVKGYACLYVHPFDDTQCWRKKHGAQPEEWLNSLDGRKEKGFFPRHEAEMLRHLAMHRKEDVHAARAIPKLAYLATIWQDQLIDEQIIKDRDMPDSQVWLAGEKRKSREELEEELAVSSLYQQ
ncbi:unnamed protein product [Rhizoctonia solani]|uniref:Uncharacterized protein n=1 Tax=Rhizoctonia solani TaxID=456999 RepID=A0A8H2XQ63_9AGAM|nr:unnamed protein product [Rhizoctonia solani]